MMSVSYITEGMLVSATAQWSQLCTTLSLILGRIHSVPYSNNSCFVLKHPWHCEQQTGIVNNKKYRHCLANALVSRLQTDCTRKGLQEFLSGTAPPVSTLVYLTYTVTTPTPPALGKIIEMCPCNFELCLWIIGGKKQNSVIFNKYTIKV